MKKLCNSAAELEKSVAYKNSLYIITDISHIEPIPEAHSELSQTSKMELFANIVNE